MVLHEEKSSRTIQDLLASSSQDKWLPPYVYSCSLYLSSTKRFQLGLEAPWAVLSMNLGVFLFTFYIFLFDCSEDAFSTLVPQSWELETILFLCSQDQTAEAVEEMKYQRPSVESWEPAMLTSFPLTFISIFISNLYFQSSAVTLVAEALGAVVQ